MPVVARIACILFCSAALLLGCRSSGSQCPQANVSADPAEIPSGFAKTRLLVEVDDARAITSLTAESGVIADPFARDTEYLCADQVAGSVEVCVDAVYDENDSLDCSDPKCMTVTCPVDKNACPAITDFTAIPNEVPPVEGTTIEVEVDDLNEGPSALETTITASHGYVTDPTALTTTYHCDANTGGLIELCVDASDGDPDCDAQECRTVECPDAPDGNVCPVIGDLSAHPQIVAEGETDTTIRVHARDPDHFPRQLSTRLSAASGVFQNRTATETKFTCGLAGPVDICVDVTDGDTQCDGRRCITVYCPLNTPVNQCPNLFVINSIPTVIPAGQTTTRIQTRGQDNDGIPLALTLSLRAPWGTITNDENIQEPQNVVAQNAIYVCDRPGRVEICVDASDGACMKTLCRTVTCPADIPIP